MNSFFVYRVLTLQMVRNENATFLYRLVKPLCPALASLLILFCITSVLAHADDNQETKSTQAKKRTHFLFEPHGAIATYSDMPGNGPYFPDLVKMDKLGHFPFDYALYSSVDHVGGTSSGIWLSVCNGDPTKSDNWKTYDRAVADGDFKYLASKPESNPIYTDPVDGPGQCETPHLNIIDGIAYMSYHTTGAGYVQSTLLSQSIDGVNFMRINGKKNSVIVDYNPGTAVGDGHTGYFRWRPNPFQGIKHKYIGYSLHGGGGLNDGSHSAIWGSNDLENWERLQILSRAPDNIPLKNRGLSYHKIAVDSITQVTDDAYLAIVSLTAFRRKPRRTNGEIYEMFFTDTGEIHSKGMPRQLLPKPDTPDEKLPNTLRLPDVEREDDQWYLVYTRDNEIHIASGTLDLKEPILHTE